MGCCVSSGKSINSTHKLDRNSTAGTVKIFGPFTDNGSREAPSAMEEETVKEVLSETPSLKPPLLPPPKNCPPEEETVGDKVKNEGDEIEKKLREIPINGIAQQASEFYEISNLKELLATSNFTDTMDGGGEVHQRVLKSSPVKLKNQSICRDVELKRELSPNKTLNRRSDELPVRRNTTVGSARLVQNRDVSPAVARRGLRAEPPRRDADENPGRRSRSPATAHSDSGGSRSSVRKPNKSAATATAPAGSKKVVEENNIIDRKSNTQIESLENPLVSLECFIFL